MIALIDGDIATYRIGYASQDIDVGLACARMDHFITDILRHTGADTYCVFLTSTDRSNFRFELYPLYKANRVAPKPLWYRELRAHLVAEHGATVIEGREADDAMADAQGHQTVICTIDKDLDQVPGKHYDFVKDVPYEISPDHGRRFFYLQILSGDRVDNVPGLEGIGPAKASRILEGAKTDSELFSRVLEAYVGRHGPRDGKELMLLYGQLLKIGGDLWLPADLVNTDPDSKLSSEESLSDSDLSTNQPN